MYAWYEFTQGMKKKSCIRLSSLTHFRRRLKLSKHEKKKNVFAWFGRWYGIPYSNTHFVWTIKYSRRNNICILAWNVNAYRQRQYINFGRLNKMMSRKKIASNDTQRNCQLNVPRTFPIVNRCQLKSHNQSHSYRHNSMGHSEPNIHLCRGRYTIAISTEHAHLFLGFAIFFSIFFISVSLIGWLSSHIT